MHPATSLRVHSVPRLTGLLPLSAVLAAAVLFLAPSLTARAEDSSLAAGIYESGQVDRAPQLKREIRIRYPREMRKEHAEVKLRFIVRASGKIDNMTVVKFSDPDMIELAYRVYEEADYTPGVKDGKPVDTWVEVTEVAK